MKTDNTRIFSIMIVVFWLIFLGLLVEGGAVVISFIVSLYNPESLKDLYMGQSLSGIKELGNSSYAYYVSFIAAFAFIKAYIAFLVIKIFVRLDLQQPFTMPVSKLMTKISYVALGAGLLAIIAQYYTRGLAMSGAEVVRHWGSGQFLFLAGIIFVIAMIFKRGVDLQSESELTI